MSRIQILRRIAAGLSVLALGACSSDTVGRTPKGTTWNGTLAGVPATLIFDDQSATLRADGGVHVRLTGQSNGNPTEWDLDLAG